MRNLIYMALFSAFFMSKFAYSSNSIPATPVDEHYRSCEGIEFPVNAAVGMCQQRATSLIADPPIVPDAPWVAGAVNCTTQHMHSDRIRVYCERGFTRTTCDLDGTCQTARMSLGYGITLSARITETTFQCPNPAYPTLGILPSGEGVCYIDNNRDPDCPEPSADDDISYAVGGQPYCFTNQDGSVCQYDVDPNTNTYAISKQYRGVEPVSCGTPPNDAVDPELPDIVEPLIPDSPSLNGPQPDPTPETGDNSDSGLEIDALNKINDNLSTMIDNNTEFDSAEFRHQEDTVAILTNLVEMGRANVISTQNTNDSLFTQSKNQAVAIDETRKTNDVLSLLLNSSEKSRIASTHRLDGIKEAIKGGNGTNPCTGPDCDTTPCEGPDCNKPCTGIECIDIGTEQGGKQGGITTLFTNEDVLTLKTQIEEQLDSNKGELESISSEMESMFKIEPSLTGGYENRTIEIKGEQIDISLRRYSEFFQMLSTPIMLAASITALFILLRER
ncbi:hypothetical protein [Pseudoalteromonas obscura]|uniref:Uncharacterized protein n=1 Tax=Pseudoalteromonas obscura TaxID=3048491 RepID=A0ABT7EK39_9GAMM|nr:hypothetical protein [Pseudoalteromonas sp. P94(2023)]MDK2595400.1 hypothetical protein [Pseudoalteromonas sp. P94(2023)]